MIVLLIKTLVVVVSFGAMFCTGTVAPRRPFVWAWRTLRGDRVTA